MSNRVSAIKHATYIIQTADGNLPNAQDLETLAAGLLKIDEDGVVFRAIPGVDYAVPGGLGTPHDLLDGVTVQDTVTQTVTRGSIVFGNLTPLWDELVIGAANSVLLSDGTDPAWTALSSVDHGLLGGLSDDDHSIYALLAGRATGQTLQGGTAANEDLTLESTSNATKGDIIPLDPLLLPNKADAIRSDDYSVHFKAGKLNAVGAVQYKFDSAVGLTASPFQDFFKVYNNGVERMGFDTAGQFKITTPIGLLAVGVQVTANSANIAKFRIDQVGSFGEFAMSLGIGFVFDTDNAFLVRERWRSSGTDTRTGGARGCDHKNLVDG